MCEQKNIGGEQCKNKVSDIKACENTVAEKVSENAPEDETICSAEFPKGCI